MILIKSVRCQDCGSGDSRVLESYAAFEDEGEVEVLVWACEICGARRETTVAPS